MFLQPPIDGGLAILKPRGCNLQSFKSKLVFGGTPDQNRPRSSDYKHTWHIVGVVATETECVVRHSFDITGTCNSFLSGWRTFLHLADLADGIHWYSGNILAKNRWCFHFLLAFGLHERRTEMRECTNTCIVVFAPGPIFEIDTGKQISLTRVCDKNEAFTPNNTSSSYRRVRYTVLY